MRAGLDPPAVRESIRVVFAVSHQLLDLGLFSFSKPTDSEHKQALSKPLRIPATSIPPKGRRSYQPLTHAENKSERGPEVKGTPKVFNVNLTI
ncbi:MAG: hypothetical protein KTR25_17810 [Myxococcales bacterium]|nr:hypothetical protein [Myxococcales bacterium]